MRLLYTNIKTVGDLRSVLSDFDDSAPVVLSVDCEGLFFSNLSLEAKNMKQRDTAPDNYDLSDDGVEVAWIY